MRVFKKIFCSFFLVAIVLLFSDSASALNPEDEVKLLKDKLKYAYDIISKLEERLTVVEEKLNTTEKMLPNSAKRPIRNARPLTNFIIPLNQLQKGLNIMDI